MGRIAVNAIVLLIAAATTPLSAAIITFDNLNIFGSQVVIEDGMRYQTSDAFGVRNFTGNPPSGLIGTPIAPGMFIVTRNGGGNFTFDRYDFASFGPPNHSDTWEFLGLLEGVQQFSFIDLPLVVSQRELLISLTQLINWRYRLLPVPRPQL